MEMVVFLAYIEIIIVILALISNSLLTYLISTSASLHRNCRGFLFMFSISMYLLTISHGLTVIEFLYGKQSLEYIYFVSVRGFYWRSIHEFGYSLQSISLVLFSVERLVASICPFSYRSTGIKILFICLSVASLFLSVAFSLMIHVGNAMFTPTGIMNCIDFSGCLILLIAWRRSINRYRSTVGIYTLEQRFQLSEVYTWSRHLIPAVLLASCSKFVVIIVIWILITGEHKGNESAILLFIYNNILNLYTVVLPFVILMKHDKIRKKVIRHRTELAATATATAHAPKTLDGRVIPSKHDYFKHLNWK